jgi:hypothetical protein
MIMMKQIERTGKIKRIARTMKIRITLEINDPETVDDCKDTHPELIYNDLRYGTLMHMTDLVSVEICEEES